MIFLLIYKSKSIKDNSKRVCLILSCSLNFERTFDKIYLLCLNHNDN